MSRQPHLYWATFAIIINDDKQILLIQRNNTWYYDGCWDVPAGHIEENETSLESMRHECLEEIGIEIDINESDVFHICHRLSPDREYFDIGILITKRTGDISINEPDKCSALWRFDLQTLPDDITPSTIQFVQAYLSGTSYSEFRQTEIK